MLVLLGFFSAMGGFLDADPPFNCALALKLVVSTAQMRRKNTRIVGGAVNLII